MISLERIEELGKDSACDSEWCFFKELVSHMGERNVIQARLIMEYRFMESRRLGVKIEPKRAEEEFIAKFGAKYGELYDKNNASSLSYDEIFLRVFNAPKVYEESLPLSK